MFRRPPSANFDALLSEDVLRNEFLCGILVLMLILCLILTWTTSRHVKDIMVIVAGHRSNSSAPDDDAGGKQKHE